jgi:hypothetical protein
MYLMPNILMVVADVDFATNTCIETFNNSILNNAIF